MSEKPKDKNAEPEESKRSNLDEGLEDTFPGSDPVSATQPGDESEKKRGDAEG